MKLLKLCLPLAALLITISLHAQTADEILAKHIEATGGKDKLAGMNSVRMENTIDIGGNTGGAAITIVNGKGYRNESEFDGQKVVQVYTDKSGWSVNPFTGINEPQAMPEPVYKGGASQIFISPFLNYAARGDKAELLGREKVGAVDAYKIKVTAKDNSSVTYLFDPTTYYLVQSVSVGDLGGQAIDLKVTYSDHKKTDYGWTLPHTSDIDFGGQFSMTTKINKVEVNPSVDAGVFEMKK